MLQSMKARIPFTAAAVLIGAMLVGAAIGFLTPASALDPSSPSCGYYTNSAGHQVPRPCGNWREGEAPPARATARCRDGTWSWSEHPHASGTCSHHGAVSSYR